MPDFCHLHVHTHYSTLDGACRIPDLIEKAKRCGMPALAITDHGNLFGAVHFHRQVKAAGLKSLIGYEAYVAPGPRTERTGGPSDSNFHLTLLCENEAGWRNLIRLATTAYLDGFYYKPRIDKEVLAEHSDGLIALSGCLSGEAATACSMGDLDRARAALSFYRDLFGPERFRVELMENGLEGQARANAGLVKLARELGLGVVATNDCHYLERDDAGAQDVLVCIGTGKRRDDPNRLRFGTDAFYFRTPEEMARLFSELPEALRSTVEIAERCELELELGKYRYPRFDVPEGETADSYLRKLVEAGALERYGEITPKVRERIDSELGIIERMDFPGYMLIVWDLVRFARERDIPVGPGRGSAAGSVVSYCLSITKLDPFRYDLIFERFMNEGRNEMPDIDLDFCQSRRDEMIDYVTRKYGRDRVAQIITFGTMAARAAIRDVGRVLDVPLPVVDSVARLVPFQPGMTLERAMEQEPELSRRVSEDPAVEEVVRIARRVEGLTRQPGKHAAGVVISDRPLTEYCPLYRQSGTDEVTTQFDMNAVTEIGLLKIDFLGLQTLTMANRAAELVEERTGRRLDLDSLPLDDEETYSLFQRGETKGVFQFESGGMRDLLRRARPDRFEELIALNAMYRPGPMENIGPFVSRKFGREPIPSITPQVDSLLRETYGVMAYQEQVMRIAQVVAGFTLPEADRLRKAMGKKKPEIMARFRQQFVSGAVERGFEEGRAAEIYDLMERFAGYGFNKSHSTAYAMLAYQTAYLKANHPTEFMAALLTLDMGKTEKVAEYADEARRMGLTILPPDVNQSRVGFTVVGDREIRFGLAAVKGVGEKAVESVIAAREEGGRFRSLLDFCGRVDLRLVNKSVVECLVKGGAFDSITDQRARLYEGIARALEIGSREQTDRAQGQGSLFDMMGAAATESADCPPGEGTPGARPDEGLPEVPPWPGKLKLSYEKFVLGIYVSSHPLADRERWIRLYSTATTRTLAEAAGGGEVVIGGILDSVQYRTARRTGNRWARLVVEDLEGSAEARVFSRALAECESSLSTESVVFLRGRVDSTGGATSLLVDEVIPFEEAAQRLSGRVTIRLRGDELDEERLDELLTMLEANPGSAEVYFRVEREGGPAVLVRAGAGVRTGPGEQLSRDIEALLGEKRLVFERARDGRFSSSGRGRPDTRRA
jgi:DNA polymerase-3 subunit alpha